MVLCVLIMFAVWLQGYPDATLQASSNIPRVAADPRNADAIVPKRLRRRLTLPQPDWFTCRAASSNAIAAQVSNADSDESSGCVVQALAKVEAASVWQNDLTYLNEEEFLGFEYFLNPTDFFSLCIDSVFPVQQTFRVASSKMFSLQRQADGVVQHRDPESFVVQLASKTVPFSPYVPGVDFARIPLVSGQQALPAQQVLNMWGLREEVDSCIVVPLPQKLLQMVLQGLWKHIPCLGRWRPLLSKLPAPVQCIVGVPGNCQPEPENGSISHAKVLDLVKKLQSWAPVLLEADHDNQRRLELTGAIRWLLNVRAALPGDHMGMPRERAIYGSLFLIRSMLMTRLMPAYVCLKEICVEALRLLFPNLLKDSLRHVLQNERLFPGEGSKHKMRLFLDVAMLLWKRKQEIKQGKHVRFSGADSSPQHGQNWLLSSCVSVPAQKMTELFHAIQRMIAERERRDLNQGRELEVELQSEQSRADHAFLLATVKPQHDIPSGFRVWGGKHRA